jgi:hypothetical protein
LGLSLACGEEPFPCFAVIDTLGLIVRRINGTGVTLSVPLQLLFIEFLEVLDTIDQLIVLTGLVKVLSAFLLEDT